MRTPEQFERRREIFAGPKSSAEKRLIGARAENPSAGRLWAGSSANALFAKRYIASRAVPVNSPGKNAEDPVGLLIKGLRELFRPLTELRAEAKTTDRKWNVAPPARSLDVAMTEEWIEKRAIDLGFTIDEGIAAQVLTRGIYSNHLDEHKRLDDERRAELEPLEAQLELIGGLVTAEISGLPAEKIEKFKEAVKARDLAAIRDIVKILKDVDPGSDAAKWEKELETAIKQGDRIAFNKTLRRARTSFGKKNKEVIDAVEAIHGEINGINERYNRLMKNSFWLANTEMENQLRTAMTLIEMILLDAETPDRLVNEVRKNVPIHVDMEIQDSTTFNTLHAFVGNNDRFAVQVRIRVGATLSEIYHELLHAAPESLRPKWIITGTNDLRQQLRILPLAPNDNPANHISTIKTMGYIEEAAAFAGQTMLESHLSELSEVFSFASDGNITRQWGKEEGTFLGCYNSDRYLEHGIAPYFNILRKYHKGYQALETEQALQFTGMSMSETLKKGYLTSTGKELGILEPLETSKGKSYRVIGDANALAKAVARLDAEGIIRTLALGRQTKQALETGREMFLPSLLSDINFDAHLAALPAGSAVAITAEPRTNRYKLDLLAELRRFALDTPESGLARFETLMAIAETSEDAYSEAYKEARHIITRFEAIGEFDFACELLASFALSILERGFETDAEDILRYVIDLMAVPGGEMTEMFISGRPTKGASKNITFETIRLGALHRLLLRAARYKTGRTFIARKFIGYFTALTAHVKANRKDESLAKYWGDILFELAAFRNAVAPLDKDLAKKISSAIEASIKKARLRLNEARVANEDPIDLPLLFDLGLFEKENAGYIIVRALNSLPKGLTDKSIKRIAGLEFDNPLMEHPSEEVLPFGIISWLETVSKKGTRHHTTYAPTTAGRAEEPKTVPTPGQFIKDFMKAPEPLVSIEPFNDTSDLQDLVVGSILAKRDEPELKEEGVARLKRIHSKSRAVFVNEAGGLFPPDLFSPLARTVMSAYFVTPLREDMPNPVLIGDETETKDPPVDKARTLSSLSFLNGDLLRAMAEIELAGAEPSGRTEHLKAAERLLKAQTSDLTVRFQNFPRTEATIFVLERLTGAYLDAGSIAGAERSAKLTCALLDEYEPMYRQALEKGQAWLKKEPKDSAFSKWMRSEQDGHEHNHDMFPSKNPETWALRDAVSALQNRVMPVHTSVGFRMEFAVRKALALARKNILSDEWPKIIQDISDDIAFQKGHVKVSLALELLRAVSSESVLAPYREIAVDLAIKSIAIKRGVAQAGSGYFAVERLKGPVSRAVNRPEDDIGDTYDILSAAYRVKSSADDLAEEGRRIKKESADAEFAKNIGDFLTIIEEGPLAREEREAIYLKFVQSILPDRDADLMEMADALPASFEAITGSLKEGVYLSVELYLYGRMAGSARGLVYDRTRPTASDAGVAGLIAACRHIAAENPELLSPRNIKEMIGLSVEASHLARLKVLFGGRIDDELSRFGKKSLDGFDYNLGEILSGKFNTAVAQLQMLNAVDRIIGAQTGRPAGERTQKEAGLILSTLIRRTCQMTNPDDAWKENEFLKKTGAIILKAAMTGGLEIFVKAAMSCDDSGEARNKAGLYYRLLESADIPPFVEAEAMAELLRAGLIGEFAYDLYMREYYGASHEKRGDFVSFITKLRGSSMGRADFFNFITTYILEDAVRKENDISAFIERIDKRLAVWEEYDNVLAVKSGVRPKPVGRNSDLIDIAIFYFIYLPRYLKLAGLDGPPTASQFFEAARNKRDYDNLNSAQFETSLIFDRHFVTNASDETLLDFKQFAEKAAEHESLSRFRLPSTLVGMPPLLQFVAINYLKKLPLGPREEVLRAFFEPDISPEDAFKRMFELTGNEKLGQFLSLMKGALPESYREKLAEFRSNVKGSSREEIESALIHAFGVKPEKVFSEFDYALKNAGSIGEVYRAVLPAGREVKYTNERGEPVKEVLQKPVAVAVKILTSARKIRNEKNLAILREIAALLKKEGRRFDLRFDAEKVFADFESSILAEMNFENELANAREFAGQLPGGLLMPRYFSSLTTPTVVVTEWVDGTTLDRVKDPAIRKNVFGIVAEMTGKGTLVNGRYYEDPHPGNILVTGDGRAYLIDFGRLGHINDTQRTALVNLFVSATLGDFNRALDHIVSAVEKGPDADEKRLRYSLKDIEQNAGENEIFTAVDSMFKLAFRHGYYVSPHIMQLLKAFLTLKGIAAEDPAIGTFGAEYLGEPFLEALERMSTN